MTGAGNHESATSHNLIMLFSQCKLHTSGISDTSLNDSINHSRHSEQQQSITEIPNTIGQHSRVSNESDRSVNCEHTSPFYTTTHGHEQHNSLRSISFDKVKGSRRISDESSKSLPYESFTSSYGDHSSSSLNRSSKGNPRRMEQNNLLSEISMRLGYQSRVSNGSSSSLTYEPSKVSPARISPLDPGRLWKESESRLGHNSPGQNYLPITSPDNAYPLRQPSTVLTVTPDELRGITRLSLSHSDLNNADVSAARRNDLSRNDGCHLSSTSSINRSMNKSLDYYSNSKSMQDTRLLSFSEISLQLPDNSNKSRCFSKYEQPGLVKSVSKDSAIGQRERKPRVDYRDQKSPQMNQGRDRSYGDSLSSRDWSSSYTSDRCLSGSQALSMSSHIHETSSGFQSAESTDVSGVSPLCTNISNKSYQQFQSTPIAENEINSISAPPVSSVVSKRTSLDNEIDGDIRPRSNDGQHNISTLPPHTRLFNVEKELNTIASPDLPPIHLSSRRSSSESSGHGRFFKDPSIDESGPMKVDPPKRKRLSSGASLRKSSLEKSSLSALLSDMSCSENYGQQSSAESLSSDSDSLKRSTRSRDQTEDSLDIRRAASLHDLDDQTGSSRQPFYPDLDTYATLPQPKHVSGYLCNNQEEKKRLEELYAEFSQASLGRPRNTGSENSMVRDYVNNDSWNGAISDDTNEHSEEYLFNRDHWRASLDKEMKDRLVADMQKMVPKKLCDLKAKHDMKKNPVTIADYTESPYKFRNRDNVNYENLMSVSRDSLASECALTNTTSCHSYENLYMVGSRLSACPIATPESLSDVVFMDNDSRVCDEGQVLDNYGVDSYHTLLPVSQSIEDRSATRSPINISGINSAFKPVKGRQRVDSCSGQSVASSNETYTVSEDSNDEKIRYGYVENDRVRQMKDACKLTDSASRIADKSKRRSNVSEISNMSPFEWSQGSDIESFSVTESSTETPRNYLRMVKRNPLSFSLPVFSGDDTSSMASRHSYTDSIPWEESVNKSLSFQTSDRNKSALSQYSEYSTFVKPKQRQPMKSLENTPEFSPIYGQDRRQSRARFMSTPKLSTETEITIGEI